MKLGVKYKGASLFSYCCKSMGHKCGSYEDGVALKYEYLYRMESSALCIAVTT